MGSALKALMLRKASGTTHVPLALTAGQEPRLVSMPLALLDLRLDHQGRHQRPAMVCDHLAGSSGHPHLHVGQGAVA